MVQVTSGGGLDTGIMVGNVARKRCWGVRTALGVKVVRFGQMWSEKGNSVGGEGQIRKADCIERVFLEGQEYFAPAFGYGEHFGEKKKKEVQGSMGAATHF